METLATLEMFTAMYTVLSGIGVLCLIMLPFGGTN